MTRIEFEADLLKDEKVEREEEVKKPKIVSDKKNILQMRLQKAELMKLVEVCSVLHEARSADQRRIARFLSLCPYLFHKALPQPPKYHIATFQMDQQHTCQSVCTQLLRHPCSCFISVHLLQSSRTAS